MRGPLLAVREIIEQDNFQVENKNANFMGTERSRVRVKKLVPLIGFSHLLTCMMENVGFSDIEVEISNTFIVSVASGIRLSDCRCGSY